MDVAIVFGAMHDKIFFRSREYYDDYYYKHILINIYKEIVIQINKCTLTCSRWQVDKEAAYREPSSVAADQINRLEF